MSNKLILKTLLINKFYLIFDPMQKTFLLILFIAVASGISAQEKTIRKVQLQDFQVFEIDPDLLLPYHFDTPSLSFLHQIEGSNFQLMEIDLSIDLRKSHRYTDDNFMQVPANRFVQKDFQPRMATSPKPKSAITIQGNAGSLRNTNTDHFVQNRVYDDVSYDGIYLSPYNNYYFANSRRRRYGF